ncbi:MAG: hypothetical protein LBL59_04885 [Xanthomonadaceae bacterium]|jgi:hypothetical protein|nr:hypothetical protein [Xanthomonadaceae bacterium]
MKNAFWVAVLIAASLPVQRLAQASTPDLLSGAYRPVGLQLGRDRNADGSWNHSPEYQVVDEARRLYLHVGADGPDRWIAWIEEDGRSGDNRLTLREVSAATTAEIVREWNTMKSGASASSAQCAATATVMVCCIATAPDDASQSDERPPPDPSSVHYVMIVLDEGYYDLKRLDDVSVPD